MSASHLKVPPVVIVLLLGGLMWGVARALPDFGFALPAQRAVASSLALAGMGIVFSGVVSFRRAKTTVNPRQPETASTLVASGIYRLTRNPMYLGMLLVLLSWATYLANAVVFALPAAFVPLMNHLQIRPEERALAAKFGAAYEAYRTQVRRWC